MKLPGIERDLQWWVFFSILTIFNILDMYLTSVILSMGGTELNPIMNWVISHGLIYGYLVKVLVNVLAGLVFPKGVIFCLIWLYLLVNIWHIVNIAMFTLT